MELIVAVYDDWGIGCCGTQPVVVSEDRKHFRNVTSGAAVIVGRKTLAEEAEYLYNRNWRSK